jgi:uncharacterized protein YjbI with pentapeptide repeats
MGTFHSATCRVSICATWHFSVYASKDQTLRVPSSAAPTSADRASDANLSSADLREADILDATLTASNLSNADMRKARSRRTELTRAKIEGLQYYEELTGVLARYSRAGS